MQGQDSTDHGNAKSGSSSNKPPIQSVPEQQDGGFFITDVNQEDNGVEMVAQDDG